MTKEPLEPGDVAWWASRAKWVRDLGEHHQVQNLDTQSREIVQELSDIGLVGEIGREDMFERVLLKLGEYLVRQKHAEQGRAVPGVEVQEIEAAIGWIGNAFHDVLGDDTDAAEQDPKGPHIPPDLQ